MSRLPLCRAGLGKSTKGFSTEETKESELTDVIRVKVWWKDVKGKHSLVSTCFNTPNVKGKARALNYRSMRHQQLHLPGFGEVWTHRHNPWPCRVFCFRPHAIFLRNKSHQSPKVQISCCLANCRQVAGTLRGPELNLQAEAKHFMSLWWSWVDLDPLNNSECPWCISRSVLLAQVDPRWDRLAWFGCGTLFLTTQPHRPSMPSTFNWEV